MWKREATSKTPGKATWKRKATSKTPAKAKTNHQEIPETAA